MSATTTSSWVVVTGGAGFIGANLVQRLLDDGNNVLVLDNFSTGRWIFPPDDLPPGRRVVVVPCDVRMPLDVIDALVASAMVSSSYPISTTTTMNVSSGRRPWRATHIYHLACPASPPQYQPRPWDTVQTCTLGTALVLDMARRDACPVLVASTSEIYGEPLEHPQRETYRGNVSCTGPRACYDEGKRVGETMALAHHQQFGTRIKIVRIFNTYGPGLDVGDGRVVSNFCVQALRGEPITLYGGGDQTRSFCYVDDLVDALVRMTTGTGDDVTGPINVGNPVECTVRDLADAIVRAVRRFRRRDDDKAADDDDVIVSTVHRDLPVDDPSRRRPDISLATATLGGWTPKTWLADGLDETVRYFDKVLGDLKLK